MKPVCKTTSRNKEMKDVLSLIELGGSKATVQCYWTKECEREGDAPHVYFSVHVNVCEVPTEEDWGIIQELANKITQDFLKTIPNKNEEEERS